MNKIIAISFLSYAFLSCHKPPGTADSSKYLVPEYHIYSLISKLLIDNEILGCSVGIARGDTIEYLKGFGHTDTTKSLGIKSSSIFPIASVTKLVTSVGILMLHENGKLSLDDSIVEYFPELTDEFKPITIKNLLNHTSGLALMTEYAETTLLQPHATTPSQWKSEG